MPTNTTPEAPVFCANPKCGRKLTSAVSIARGYGRVCYNRKKETLARVVREYKAEQVNKALELIRSGAFVPLDSGRAFKATSSDGLRDYFVSRSTCNCAAGSRGVRCYHRAAFAMMAD